MLQLKPLDENVSIFQQLGADVSPVIPVSILNVAESDIPALLKAWEDDANWMKQQPGYISTQLHQGIAGSTVFMNYAVSNLCVGPYKSGAVELQAMRRAMR